MFQIHVTYKHFCFTSFAEKMKKESPKGCTSSLSDGPQNVKPSQEFGKNTSKKGKPVHRDYLWVIQAGLDLHTVNLMGHCNERYSGIMKVRQYLEMAPCRIIHEIITPLGFNHMAQVNTIGRKPSKRSRDNRLKPLTHCTSGHNSRIQCQANYTRVQNISTSCTLSPTRFKSTKTDALKCNTAHISLFCWWDYRGQAESLVAYVADMDICSPAHSLHEQEQAGSTCGNVMESDNIHFCAVGTFVVWCLFVPGNVLQLTEVSPLVLLFKCAFKSGFEMPFNSSLMRKDNYKVHVHATSTTHLLNIVIFAVPYVVCLGSTNI